MAHPTTVEPLAIVDIITTPSSAHTATMAEAHTPIALYPPLDHPTADSAALEELALVDLGAVHSEEVITGEDIMEEGEAIVEAGVAAKEEVALGDVAEVEIEISLYLLASFVFNNFLSLITLHFSINKTTI